MMVRTGKLVAIHEIADVFPLNQNSSTKAFRLEDIHIQWSLSPPNGTLHTRLHSRELQDCSFVSLANGQFHTVLFR